MNHSESHVHLVSIAKLQHKEAVLQQWHQLTSSLPDHHFKPFGIPLPDLQKVQLKRTLEQCFERDDAQIFIAGDNSVKGSLGVILNQQNTYTKPDSSVLFNLWVEPNFRRQGIGDALVAAAREWLKGQGVTSVQAGWHPSNIVADKFWRKQGFESYETIGAQLLV